MHPELSAGEAGVASDSLEMGAEPGLCGAWQVSVNSHLPPCSAGRPWEAVLVTNQASVPAASIRARGGRDVSLLHQRRLAECPGRSPLGTVTRRPCVRIRVFTVRSHVCAAL